MPICSASLKWVLIQQPAGRKDGSLKWCLVMKLWYPRATVHTISHSPVHRKNNTWRDVTCDMRIIWESQAFLVQAIAGIRGDIPRLTFIWWHANQQYAIIPKEKGSVASAFFMGKLSLPQMIIAWRCLSETIRRHPRQDDTFSLGFLQWGGGDGEARWQVARALEWERSQVTCLPGYQGWISCLWPSLFDSMIYLKVRPSDAKDEITPYKEAMSYLDPIYLQTLLQRLPN